MKNQEVQEETQQGGDIVLTQVGQEKPVRVFFFQQQQMVPCSEFTRIEQARLPHGGDV